MRISRTDRSRGKGERGREGRWRRGKGRRRSGSRGDKAKDEIDLAGGGDVNHRLHVLGANSVGQA